MDTWMEEEHPWLKDEKEAIKEFVIEKEKPFLGFCLGCQLLGEVIGGSVTKSSPPEIGILDIILIPKVLFYTSIVLSGYTVGLPYHCLIYVPVLINKLLIV